MFLIAIPVEDLLGGKMFPDIGLSEYKLIEALTNYYSYGPYTPSVRIDSGMAIIEVDDALIIKDESAYRKATKLCETGKFKEAKATVKKLLEKSPNVSEYNRLYGQILSELGDHNAAIKHLLDAIKWDYNNKWAFIMLGNINARHKGDLDQALAYYNRALAIDPNNNILLNNIGANLASRGRFEEAMDYFVKAREIDPNYPNTHHGIALSQYNMGLFGEAFDNSISCLKLCKQKDQLYLEAYKLALTAADEVSKRSDAMVHINALIEQIKAQTGKDTRIEIDDNLGTAAKVQIAESHDRDYHLVIYNSKNPAYQHLLMHELMHVILANKARDIGRNKLYTTTSTMREAFVRDNSQTIEKLVGGGYPEKQVADFLEQFYLGLNTQMFNAPVDLLIEDEIYNLYPDMRPLQMVSLSAIINSGLDACNGKKAVALSPRKHLSQSRILNAVVATHYESLYGVKMVDEFKCDQDEKNKVSLIMKAYNETKNSFTPGDEYDLVDRAAYLLKLSKYYKLVPEQEYKEQQKTQTRKPIPEGGRTPNMAVVMYLTSAISSMMQLEREKVREIGYEIAEIGKKGIDTNSTELDQTLESVPGKQFTGLQLTAWMYAAWRFFEPSLDTGLDYDLEYELAMKMVEMKNHGEN